ncbi:MAG TPA: hypothetical protein VF815_28035 [Myxococcaceae bacterium]|jgi:hypothetical protein
MEAAEAGLRRQLEAAEAYAATVREEWFLTDAQRAALKAIEQERKRFTTWSTAWKGWAIKGEEPSPTGPKAYPVNFWLRIGGDMASALKVYASGLYNPSLYEGVKYAVQETAKTVTSPSLWPTSLTLATGGVVALAVGVVLFNLYRATRAA